MGSCSSSLNLHFHVGGHAVYICKSKCGKFVCRAYIGQTPDIFIFDTFSFVDNKTMPFNGTYPKEIIFYVGKRLVVKYNADSLTSGDILRIFDEFKK